MGSYSLRILASAEKELRKVPRTHLRRIVEKIKGLSQEPRPPGSEKLSGEDRYRLRQGDWRVVYSVEDARREVVVVKIGHRREVYR